MGNGIGKMIAHDYVDGKGFVMREVTRWRNYCPLCRKMCVEDARKEIRARSKERKLESSKKWKNLIWA